MAGIQFNTFSGYNVPIIVVINCFVIHIVAFNFAQESITRSLQRGVEQGGKSPFSLLSEPISPSSLLCEPISPSSLKINFSFSPSSLLFPAISPSSQLYLGHFSLLPILFLPPLCNCPIFLSRRFHKPIAV